MRVWLLQRSEPTPHDNEGKQRPMRAGILAEMLIRRGHQVIWWTSTFDHYNRCQRFEKDTKLKVADGYEIQYLKGCGYKKNVSIGRIRDNKLIAKRFADLARKEEYLPDVILASIPTAELALAAVDYGVARGIPIVLDVRDLWPDAFWDFVPDSLKGICGAVSIPMEWNLKKAFSGATAIVAITDAFVNWGVNHSGRQRSPDDQVFVLGYMGDEISESRMADGLAFWNQLGVRGGEDELVVVFMGTLGRVFDFTPIMEAARILNLSGYPIKFVICGAGERVAELESQARDLDNVVLPGWVYSDQIKALLKLASVGVAPYMNTFGFMNTISNKAAEYMSGGLAVALSLGQGPLYELLKKGDCGLIYNGSGAELAEGLVKLTSDRTRLSELQSNALKIFHEHLDGHVIYSEFVSYLERMSER